MKKIFNIFSLFLFCQILAAQQSVIVPVPYVPYTITLSSGNLLTSGAATPVINVPSADLDQVFLFEPVSGEDNTYYIQSYADDKYLVRTGANAWTMGWLQDYATGTESGYILDNAKYQIVPVEGTTYVRIKNIGSGSYVGVDNTAPGNSAYANKGTGDATRWTIKEWSDEVDKTALIIAHDEAKTLYEATEEGTGSDQYPTAIRQPLATAIADAKTIIDDANDTYTQQAVNGAILTLTAAVTAYKTGVSPFLPSTTANYYINLAQNNLYFSSSLVLENATYATTQQVKFVAVASKPGIFNIQSVATNNYLTRDNANPSNGWGLLWSNDPTTELAQFEIKKTGADTSPYTIRTLGVFGTYTEANSFIGINNWGTTGAGASIETDKNGQSTYSQWRFTDVATLGVVKDALITAIDKAVDFLQYATSGDGSDQYPATEYNALTAAKTIAEGLVTNEFATQLAVGDATIALNNALTACIAAVNPFQPDVTKQYRIQHYGDLFLGVYSDDTHTNAIAILTETNASDQLIQFTATTTLNAYNIQVVAVEGQYITRCTDQQVDGSGSLVDGKYDDYKLIWGTDATVPFAQFEIKKTGNQDYHTIKCITAGPQRTTSYFGTNDTNEKSGISVDKDGKSNNHTWKIIEAIGGSGIAKVSKGNVSTVYADNKTLKVVNLTGNNNIAIYTTLGQLISVAETNSDTYTKELSSGNYIVVVNGDAPYRGIIVVR